MTSDEKAQAALDIGMMYGGYDGEHHKAWVIDQMIRILAGSGYNELVRQYCDEEDGPNTYTWEVGIAP